MALFHKLTNTFILLITLSVVFVFLFLETGGVVGSCSEYEVSRLKSPAKDYEARVLLKDCGTTTAIATHVQLSRLDTHQIESVFITESSHHISLSWSGKNDFMITFQTKEGELIFKKLDKWEEVKIIYDPEV